jgi:TIR domain
MKILLSHSWEDKSLATQLQNTLETDGHEVWFDIMDLIEGDAIQKTIDIYINKCDVMVLLWSKKALLSEGVSCEIKTAKNFNKRIIPVIIDNTPLSLKDELDGLLGVPAQQFEIGSLILRRALLMVMIPDEYKSTAWFTKAYSNVKDLGGYLKYIQTYRLKGDRNDDGHKEEWVKLLEQLKTENEYIRQQIMPKNNADMAYLQNIITKIEKGNNSREQLQEWLQWCKQNENAQTDLIKQLIIFIEKDIERLNAGGKPVRVLNDDIVSQAIQRLQTAIYKRKDNAEKSITDKINKFTFGLLGAVTNQKITNGLMGYVIQCPVILSELLQESSLSEFVAVKETLVTIATYLEKQDHALEERKNNLEGYFDDAYLINNTAKLLIEADLIAKNKISLDFGSLNFTESYFSMMIPAASKQKVDAVLMEVRNIIGLKKKEINWGQVAAVLVGGIIVANGVSTLSNQFSTNSMSNNGATDIGGGCFEDQVANFSAKYGGGLSAYTPVNYG